MLLSDHGQTPVEQAARLEAPLAAVRRAGCRARLEPGRAGYLLLDARVDAAKLARRLRRRGGSRDVTLRLEDGEAVARREREELRFRPAPTAGRRPATQSRPSGCASALLVALANPNAGELLVSAAPGWEFADLGGRHHAGGGSHGSLVEGDSIVPVLTVGIEATIESITDVTPAVLSHFGVPLVYADDPAVVLATRAMVERQLRARGIDDERVLAAMATVPRERFVSSGVAARAYDDAALRSAQVRRSRSPTWWPASARSCAARRREGARRRHRLRLPGCGARRARYEVHSLERIPGSCRACTRDARRAGYAGRVHVHVADGTLGWAESAPYERSPSPRPPGGRRPALHEQLDQHIAGPIAPLGDWCPWSDSNGHSG